MDKHVPSEDYRKVKLIKNVDIHFIIVYKCALFNFSELPPITFSVLHKDMLSN